MKTLGGGSEGKFNGLFGIPGHIFSLPLNMLPSHNCNGKGDIKQKSERIDIERTKKWQEAISLALNSLKQFNEVFKRIPDNVCVDPMNYKKFLTSCMTQV